MKNFIKVTEIETHEVLRINLNNIISYTAACYSSIDDDDVVINDCISLQFDKAIYISGLDKKVDNILVHGLCHEFDHYLCFVKLTEQYKIDDKAYLESL